MAGAKELAQKYQTTLSAAMLLAEMVGWYETTERMIPCFVSKSKQFYS